MKKKISIENAKIIFRNFSGKPGKFNPAGVRNFCVILDRDVTDTLVEDGWNIRYLQPRDEDDQPTPYVQVSVRYDNFPPKIVLISSNGQSILDESEVNIIDWAEIENVDLIINASPWEISGKSGVKAYLKSMYVTIVEDEFEAKYQNVPDSAVNAIGGCGQCSTCDGNCGCHG